MKKSAGILLYKKIQGELFILLVHPGGPYWKNKDSESWSIPKGEFNDKEAPLEAAIREFEEEIGTKIQGNFMELIPVKQKTGKLIYAWALEQDIDTNKTKSNVFEMEWPPHSGILQNFPEIDKVEWFSIHQAMEKINLSQRDFISQLIAKHIE